MMTNRFISVIAMWATLLFLPSCTNRDLCFDHNHIVDVELVFEWDNSQAPMPESMIIYFYNTNGQIGLYSIEESGSGKLRVPVGQYNIIAYNDDCSDLQAINTDSFERHELTTTECSILAPILGVNATASVSAIIDETVTASPKMIWCATEKNVIVHEKSDTIQRITLAPKQIASSITFELQNVTGLEHVEAVSASLSGLPSSVILESGTLSSESVTMPFLMTKTDESTLRGTLYFFGHQKECFSKHQLLLFLWMRSGNRFLMGSDSDRFNISPLFHNEEQTDSSYFVTINGVNLPKPIGGGGGFDPSFDDWVEVNVTIDI